MRIKLQVYCKIIKIPNLHSSLFFKVKSLKFSILYGYFLLNFYIILYEKIIYN